MSLDLVTLLYLVASVCFIQALEGPEPSHHVDPRQPLRHDRHGDRRGHHRGADRQARRRPAQRPGLGAARPGGRRRLRRLARQDGRDDQDARAGGVLPQHDRPGRGVHRRGRGGWSRGRSASPPSGDPIPTGNRLELVARRGDRRDHLQRLGDRLRQADAAPTSSACSRARRCVPRASTCSTWCSGWRRSLSASAFTLTRKLAGVLR